MDNKEYIDEVINTYLSYDESENDIRGYDAIRDTLDSITSDLQDKFDSYTDEELCDLYAKCFTTLSSIYTREITDLNTKVQAIVFERICELTMIEVGKRKAVALGFFYDPELNMVTRMREITPDELEEFIVGKKDKTVS